MSLDETEVANSIQSEVPARLKEFNIVAAHDHLRRYVGKNPVSGVAELIWNSLDADATSVEVIIHQTQMGALDSLTVIDDGHGFEAEEIKGLFSTLGGSWKLESATGRTRSGNRLLHGQKGHGRWRALAIGDFVTWESVVERTPGERRLSRLDIDKNHIDIARWSGPAKTSTPVGTKVVVRAGTAEPSALLHGETPRKLCAIFALYLERYPEVNVSYNGKALNPAELQVNKTTIPLNSGSEHGLANLTIVEWSIEVDREMALCDANGSTLETISAGVHAPGFQFTAYVCWDGFRHHQNVLSLVDMGSPEISHVLEEARDELRNFLRVRRELDQRTVVETWQDEGVYPYDHDSQDPVEQANQALFNYVAVAAHGALDSIQDQTAKKLSMSTIRIALESDPGSLEAVIGEVLKLPQKQLDEFRGLLEKTSLSAIIAASKMVTDRLSLIQGLRRLIFDSTINGTILERAHLHNIVEDAPWIFGEEFATHVSDQTLTTLLRTHIGLLDRQDLVDSVTDSAKVSDRRVDFMLGRALESHENEREHLVVEIKRPSQVLKREHFDQIEDYANQIVSDSRFDHETTKWRFVLVGTSIHKNVESRVHQKDKPIGLFHDPEGGPQIWARTWAQIFADCEHRLKFIRHHLQYDPTNDEALNFLRIEYPDYLPIGLRGEATNDST